MLFKKQKVHDSKAVDSLRIINDQTPFAIKEAFSSLSTNVIYLPIMDKCKKIAITSAQPEWERFGTLSRNPLATNPVLLSSP